MRRFFLCCIFWCGRLADCMHVCMCLWSLWLLRKVSERWRTNFGHTPIFHPQKLCKANSENSSLKGRALQTHTHMLNAYLLADGESFVFCRVCFYEQNQNTHTYFESTHQTHIARTIIINCVLPSSHMVYLAWYIWLVVCQNQATTSFMPERTAFSSALCLDGQFNFDIMLKRICISRHSLWYIHMNIYIYC